MDLISYLLSETFARVGNERFQAASLFGVGAWKMWVDQPPFRSSRASIAAEDASRPL